MRALTRDLDSIELGSAGMKALAEYAHAYVASGAFKQLCDDVEGVSQLLSGVRYTLAFRPGRVIVRDDVGGANYTTLIEQTFERFRRASSKDYRTRFSVRTGLNHVEAEILTRVAALHPEPFTKLADFCVTHPAFVDERLERFDCEVHFYLAYLRYIEPLRSAGLALCYPQIVESHEVEARDAFDLALANRLVRDHRAIVTNDFLLAPGERLILVSGPNQGGKTTFGRVVGQLYFLASIGCAVPAADARLAIADHVLTHFERAENVSDLRGKLKDDLVRVRSIVDVLTPRSVVVMNEVFSSTSLVDAVALSRSVITKIVEHGALGVWVTFLPELETTSNAVVSMVAGVAPNDPSVRTFKLDRRAPTGVAYARALASKYGLTYTQLKEKLA